MFFNKALILAALATFAAAAPQADTATDTLATGTDTLATGTDT